MEKKSEKINKEKKIKKEKKLKDWKSDKIVVFIFLLTLMTGYFYFSRDYTPKKILIKNQEIEKEIENKLYIYFPENEDLLSEEIIVKGKLSSSEIVGETIKEVISKLKMLGKIPQINLEKEIGYFIIKDKLYLDIPEKLFNEVNSPREELLIIYSFVNSLTNIEGIEKVRFLIDNIDQEKVKYSNLMKDYIFKRNI
ncbi:GerMN domain-containing protein [Fusobacterium sp. MFO224]|uniref:GerMN domain-containing protein n=1 Tax=Fusobacterium sp. MFO224 TaxID=3378070 RepID=UPI0038540A78